MPRYRVAVNIDATILLNLEANDPDHAYNVAGSFVTDYVAFYATSFDQLNPNKPAYVGDPLIVHFGIDEAEATEPEEIEPMPKHECCTHDIHENYCPCCMGACPNQED